MAASPDLEVIAEGIVCEGGRLDVNDVGVVPMIVHRLGAETGVAATYPIIDGHSKAIHVYLQNVVVVYHQRLPRDGSKRVVLARIEDLNQVGNATHKRGGKHNDDYQSRVSSSSAASSQTSLGTEGLLYQNFESER